MTVSAATASSYHHRGSRLTWEAIRAISRRFEPIHTGIGIFGNISFFVGSLLFMNESLKMAGTWLFILGSFGMLIGSIGRAIVRVETRKRVDQARDEARAAPGVQT